MILHLHILLNYSVLFLSLLLYSHFFSYILWKDTIGPKLIWLFIFGCLTLNIALSWKNKGQDVNRGIIFLLHLIPIVAVLIKYAFKSQPIDSERITILMFFATTQYLLLKSLHVTEKQIINIFVIYGLITFILQIYQQQPDSIPLFGIIGNDESYIGTERNGVFRFYIGSYFIAIILFYYWWTRLLSKISLTNVAFFCLFAASIYFYLVRQLMAISLLTISFSILMIGNKKIKIWASVGLLAIGILFLTYYDILFSEFVEDYTHDTWTTDIRFKCMAFTIDQIFDNPLQAFFGHGRDIIVLTWSRMHYDLSDIGIIGESYYYGIIWGLLYIITIFAYIVKYRKRVPLFIRLFFIATLIDCLFIFPYRSNVEMFIWVCLLYIGHLHIDNKNDQYCHLIAK